MYFCRMIECLMETVELPKRRSKVYLQHIHIHIHMVKRDDWLLADNNGVAEDTFYLQYHTW